MVRFGWLERLPLRRVLGRQLRLPSAGSMLSGAALATIVLSLSQAFAVRGSSPISTAASAFLLYGAVSIAFSANGWAITAGHAATGMAPFAIAWLLATGVFSALIGLFSGLLFVSPEGNAFCALASRCAGLVGSAGAARVLAGFWHAAPAPSPKELTGIPLTFGAIACLFAANRGGRRKTTPTVEKPLAVTEAQ